LEKPAHQEPRWGGSKRSWEIRRPKGPGKGKRGKFAKDGFLFQTTLPTVASYASTKCELRGRGKVPEEKRIWEGFLTRRGKGRPREKRTRMTVESGKRKDFRNTKIRSQRGVLNLERGRLPGCHNFNRWKVRWEKGQTGGEKEGRGERRIEGRNLSVRVVIREKNAKAYTVDAGRGWIKGSVMGETNNVPRENMFSASLTRAFTAIGAADT